jgi:opacity protein-like surface antigen
MSRTVIAGIIVAALLATAVAVPAAAQRGFGVQIQGGYAFPEENKHRGGPETGFGVFLPLAGRMSLSFEFMRWTVRSLGSPGKLYPGRIEISPVAAAVRFEFLRNQFFYPYGFAGVAFVFSRFEIGPVASIPEVKINQKIENGFAPYLGFGARLALSPALSFTCEVAYLARTAKAQTIFDDMNSGISTEDLTANLRTVFLKFGLQGRF